MLTPNVHGPVFEALLARCPPLPAFDPPWDFVPPPADCRGPVPDPAATLAALRAGFGDAALVRAGVLVPAAGGPPRLAPGLETPGGALIPLFRRPGERPSVLLTARGCLPAGLPALAALGDRWTAGRAAACGVLFATPRVREAALLRALGLPATLSLGLGRLAPVQLRYLDARFAAQPFGAPGGEPGGAAGAPPPRPTLALAGWSPLPVCPRAPGPVADAAGRLAAVRRHLGLGLAGVMAWRPRAGEVEALRFRLGFRDAGLVREWVEGTADALDDLEHLAAAPGPPAAGYPAALDDLLAALAAGGAEGAGADGRLGRARAAYEAAVRRDLVGPLREWALASADPLARAAGAELAAAAGLLHRMTPLVTGLLDARFDGALRDGAEPVPAGAFGQYATLVARFGGLLRDLARLRAQ